MGVLSNRLQQLKQKRPAYAPLLDFYVAVREAQQESKPRIRIARVKAVSGRPLANGFPLIGEAGFPIDSNSSVSLFGALCGLGKAANPHFAAQAERIERAVVDGLLNLGTLLVRGAGEGIAERVASERGLDARILSFLVLQSRLPSIEAARDRLLEHPIPEAWRKPSCPICGSAPGTSVLKGEPALRHSVCSCCRCQWQVDRLSCSICGNDDQDSLQYFYAEGEIACRIDCCDSCHHYIKTIDLRALEVPDACMEDLATLHLDVVARAKGYSRVVPDPWDV